MGKKYGKEAVKAAGHLVRVGSAIGTTGASISSTSRWFRKNKNYPVKEVIGELGTDVTGSIDEAFGLYGIGEGVTIYGQIREDKENGIKPNALECSGRVLRLSPAAAPVISRATKNNFVKSVLIPAGLCILGWGVEYVGRMSNKERD